MSTTLPPGPYDEIALPDGSRAPWYLIPFDKRGVCTAPQTRADLVEKARAGAFTDLFLFSHGWNNDFATANGRYRAFIERFQGLRQRFALSLPQPYRPLLVGVTWPSTALVLPWEQGPQMAAAADDPSLARDGAMVAEQQALADLAEELPAGDVTRFYELAARLRLTEGEALELARMVAPLYARAVDAAEDGSPDHHEPAALLELWQRAAVETGDSDPPQHGFAAGEEVAPGAGGGAGPAAAGFLPFDPRGPIRAFTVWKMKDRAGRVGTAGVGKLLGDLLLVSSARAHLVGHSYGAKVVLSALLATPPGQRPVDSVLLLQPAVNGYCFAANVPGAGKAGGYRPVLDRVVQPILTTFSKHDAPLTRFFHLAVRRSSDLGEVQVAAAAPSRYAALGGFGPQGCTAQECREVPTKVPGNAEPRDRYVLAGANAPRLWALQGEAHIDGHGGIVNDATAWALYCQVEQRG